MQSGPADLGRPAGTAQPDLAAPKVLFFQTLPGFRADLVVRAFDQQTIYTIHRAPGIRMKMTELQGLGGPSLRSCLGCRLPSFELVFSF